MDIKYSLFSVENATALKQADELVLNGGNGWFSTVKSTSNLVRPDIEKFFHYSKFSFAQKQYTNNGPNVKLLEQRLAELHKTEFCIAFCNGFWALVLAIKALARDGKSEIIMPSLTYRRMADVAAWADLKPHFCEVDPATLALNASTVNEHINDDTALILAVHPIVNCCAIEELVSLAKERDLPILFDSVESVYESIAAGKIGEFGDAEVFSLHASKLLNGFEGGYITTNNAELAQHLGIVRGFGFMGIDNVVAADGMNAKLNEVHAAMALASLDDLDAQVVRNRERYYLYRMLLQSVPELKLLEFDERYSTSYKNIVVELSEDWPLTRDDTIRFLNKEGVLVRAYYSPALHQKSMTYPHVLTGLPVTEILADKYLNLPCGHLVGLNDIRMIVDLLAYIRFNAQTIIDKLHMEKTI